MAESGPKSKIFQDFLAMRLLAGYSGYVNPPISSWLIILSRCTGAGMFSAMFIFETLGKRVKQMGSCEVLWQKL